MTELIPAWIGDDLRPIEKMEVHRRGLRHKAVSVFVMDGDRTLIQRRALAKYHTPGLWANTCCTHPLWNEDAATCALRRLNEELGISGLGISRRDQVEYRADVGGGMTEHEVVDIFVAKAPATLPIVMNPAEVMGVRWVALEDLIHELAETPARFTPWLGIYMTRHRDAIFGTFARA